METDCASEEVHIFSKALKIQHAKEMLSDKVQNYFN